MREYFADNRKKSCVLDCNTKSKRNAGVSVSDLPQIRLDKISRMMNPVQCALISSKTFKKPSGRMAMVIRRGIALGLNRRGWSAGKRNLFHIRFASRSGTRHYNLTLRSAGMGGPHPMRRYGSVLRTAGHTEPQIAALLKNHSFRAILNAKLGANWKVESVFSSNAPCSSSGGGTPTGCGSMDETEFGSPSAYYSHSDAAYVGGKGPKSEQVIRNLTEIYGDDEDSMSENSDDEAFKEDEVRGKILDDIDCQGIIDSRSSDDYDFT